MSAENKGSVIVSACLLGLKCRYDGKGKPNLAVINLADKHLLVPVCPEQLGGLTTPRPAAEIIGEQVITEKGDDVTEEFQKGAEECVGIAGVFGAKTAILKARSPSCGSGIIYDGTFTKTLTEGDGVFAKKCKENGIEVITEEELENL